MLHLAIGFKKGHLPGRRLKEKSGFRQVGLSPAGMVGLVRRQRTRRASEPAEETQAIPDL